MPRTALNRPNSQAKPRVAVIGFPWKSYAPYKFLSELIIILDPISDKIVLIDGNTGRIDTAQSSKIVVRDIGISMHYLEDLKPKYLSAVIWIFKWILFQFRASLELARTRADVDIVIFYTAYPGYLLPLVVTKLLRKKSVAVILRSKSTTKRARIWRLQDPILFSLLDGISPESRGLIKDLGIEKYGQKVLPEGARFIDASYYKIDKHIDERELIVGFIGRLNKEKGVVEFLDAIPLVSRSNNKVKFLIGGSGDLSHYVAEKSKDLTEEYGVDIEVTGWIEKGLPDYLNRLRLFVLPTYFDAFPTSVLEAMACGAPVLATAKGGILDVIRDEETGFIMEDNTSTVIAENITRAISYHDMGKIVANARNVIERKFTYINAVERWRRILELAVGE